MASLRRAAVSLLLLALLLAAVPGCGGGTQSPETAWRQEVDGSLRRLEGLRSLRYRVHLETWIGVSGQNVYGDERGEGSYLEGDYAVSMVRTSPAGEENLVYAVKAGEGYVREGETWKTVSPLETPSPLYDPLRIAALLSSYEDISLQGEEERSGTACRRYLLRLGGNRARDALTEGAWSYFSSLRYELSCTLWVAGDTAPPASLRLEITGLDPREGLQRYRSLVSADLYDFDSIEVRPIYPGE